MTAQQLELETYSKLCSLNYARKANSFYEALPTSFPIQDSDVQGAIKMFPKIYIDPREDLMGVDTLDGQQQFYVVENEDGIYLVDTQGYTYPRYITQLVDYNPEAEVDADLEVFERMDGLVRISDMLIYEAVIKSLVLELKEEGFERSDISNYLEMKLFATIVKTMKK